MSISDPLPEEAESQSPARASRATLKDVARECGVHYATVSAVLHGGRTGTRVSDDLRHTIQEAARRLGYRPNLAARALRKGSLQVVGWACGESPDGPELPLQATFLSALRRCCGRLSQSVLLPWDCSELSAEHLGQWADSGLVDGVLLLPGPLVDQSMLAKVLRTKLVCLLDESPHFPSVSMDLLAAGAMQARRLAKTGHRSVALMKCGPEDPPSCSRCAGFLKEAEEAGMEVVRMDGEELLERGGEEADPMEVIRGLGTKVTAVAAWTDEAAHWVIRGIRRKGLRVPGDVAVMGFLGCQPQLYNGEQLTTIRADFEGMTSQAMELLNGSWEGTPPSSVTLPTLVSGSTA